MDRAGFGARASGTLVPTIGGRRAFVPSPLPPAELDLAALSNDLAEASAAVGELRGIGRVVTNPLLLIRPLQRREAVSSSSMEGTYTTLSDLLLFEAGSSDSATRHENVEVRNYIQALEGALASLADLPISPRLLRAAHARLLAGVGSHRGARVEPGELKRDQNLIGGGGRIESARFIPPPPREAADALDSLMAYVNGWRERTMPPLIDAALVHYQFESIHPFADGNGRVGRMLIALMLADNGLLPQPFLYLSPYLERHKDRYIDLMFEVSRAGDWTPWLRFFLDAARASAEQTVEVIERLRTLERGYREKLQTARTSALMLRIVELAFERPVRSINEIAQALDVTYNSAANNVNKLVEMGLARDVGSYPRLVIFPEIITALQG